MTARALRLIEADLFRLANDPDPIDHDAVRTAARRIGAQAEWAELETLHRRETGAHTQGAICNV